MTISAKNPGTNPGIADRPRASRQAVILASRRNRLAGILLLVVLLVCLGYLALHRRYYDWTLSGPRMTVEVICHTEPLKQADLQVFVYYDKLALSPLARGLGLYQNRPPARVKHFYVHRVKPENVTMEKYAVTLADVPQGPVAKVYFAAGGKKYFADVTDRALKDGTLYVQVDSE